MFQNSLPDKIPLGDQHWATDQLLYYINAQSCVTVEAFEVNKKTLSAYLNIYKFKIDVNA